MHQHVHDVPGMLGSLNCSHTFWKNFTKGFQGSYVGKPKKPTIILELVCDYNLWIWHHATFGRILWVAQWHQRIEFVAFLGRHIGRFFFEKAEKEAGVAPYKIAGESFPRFFLWLPAFTLSTLVLKEKFQWVGRLIRQMDMKEIGDRMVTCLILHIMAVEDQVMSNGSRYNPMNAVHRGYAKQSSASVAIPSDTADAQLSSRTQEGDFLVGQRPTTMIQLWLKAGFVNARMHGLHWTINLNICDLSKRYSIILQCAFTSGIK